MGLKALGKRAVNGLIAPFGVQFVRTEALALMEVAPPTEQGRTIGDEHSAAHFHALGVAARGAGDDDAAFRMFSRAISLIPRYEPAQRELRAMSTECLARLEPNMDAHGRLLILARALELDPQNQQVRRDLEQAHVDRQGGADLTKMCFIFYDGERARRIHEEAYKRALEFVTIGGVVGDVLEFGVLGGWSARIFAEIMRDILNLNNLHLFDSFEGLPEYASAIDRDSYEIGGRNLWGDRMRFPETFVEQFGQPHYYHIRDRLSEVLRPDRIIIHKGFYSETLKKKLGTKASIVHIDCDLYQSTVEVLRALYKQDVLQDGTVVLFDDFNCNRANPNYGERRAWREFLSSQQRFSASPWFTYGFNAAAFILHDIEV